MYSLDVQIVLVAMGCHLNYEFWTVR